MAEKPERPYLEIETGKLKDTFTLVSFSSQEEFSRLFRFTLELESEEQDVKPEDVHGFVNVVPMADAEIIELHHEGYAYMK